MKKLWFSAALALLLILLIPAAAFADVIYPAPPAMTVGQQVDHLLATLDPGGTVSTNEALMPQGLYLETETVEEGVDVYLRGIPAVPGTYDLIINYNGSNSICTLEILPGEDVPSAPVSVSVATEPALTRYTAGDTLDPAGLSLLVELSDGSSTTVTEGFTLYPTHLSQPGTQQIEVYYEGLLCYFEVEVDPAPEIIEGIGVLTLPDKIVYESGEALEPAGLSIRVYTNNGTRDVGAEELQCSPMQLDAAGSQTITVEYEGFVCRFSVQVLEEETPAGLAVLRLPDKLDYYVGDTLDTSGLVLLLTGSRDSVQYLTSKYSCEPFVLNQAGTQEILVRYQDLECRFHVVVRNPSPSGPIPVPVEEDAPPRTPSAPDASQPTVAPLPADAPQSVVIPESADRMPYSQSGLLAGVIVAAAFLALLVLGGYVFLMNRSGKEYFAESLRDLFRGKRK